MSRNRPSNAPLLSTLAPLIQRADLSIGSKAPSAAGSWRTGLSTHERGYDHTWRQARAAFLREHPLCEMCDREGRVTAADVVDHRIPHCGDKTLFWSRSNWAPLCTHHHSSVKQREEAAARRQEF